MEGGSGNWKGGSEIFLEWPSWDARGRPGKAYRLIEINQPEGKWISKYSRQRENFQSNREK